MQFQNISDQIISYLQKVPRTVVGYIYTFKGSIDVKQIEGENTNIVLHLLCNRNAECILEMEFGSPSSVFLLLCPVVALLILDIDVGQRIDLQQNAPSPGDPRSITPSDGS